MDFLRELQTAKEIAKEAGKVIMEIYESGDLGVEYKADESPLTIADRRANRMIVDALTKEFPSYAILSEEEKDCPNRLLNDYCFVVDPLDGTKEFVKRNGQFTVNIALSYQHESVMGVICVPVTGELYYAVKDCGSYYERDGISRRLHVDDTKRELSELRVVMSSSHGCEQMDELIRKYRLKHMLAMGSSLKGCLIAKGEADIYYRHNPTMEWDTAAMQCIVEEAGAIFRQMDDSLMRYNRRNSLNDKGFYIVAKSEYILK